MSLVNSGDAERVRSLVEPFAKGYLDGTFHPTQTVTRAELIAMLQAVDRYLVEFRGNWAGCRFYTQPVPFAPDTAAQRNYAAATIGREV